MLRDDTTPLTVKIRSKKCLSPGISIKKVIPGSSSRYEVSKWLLYIYLCIFFSFLIVIYNWVASRASLFNKYRSLDCALFCYKARRKRLEHERSVGRNTRRSRVFLPTSLFYSKESVKFPKHYFQFSKQTLFPKRTTVSSACSILS